jgi:putative peptidoglycan lipid II flippase
MKNIARNSVVVTLFNVAGSLLVFLSSVVIAYKFGAGREMDVYFAATSLPFFIMTILSLTLNFTFIPFFATYNAKAGAEKWKIVSSFINSTIILTAILAGAGMVFSERIMEVITPGFSQDKLTEAARLMAL